MPDHCPKDGGFIGDAGCTHPNHVYSEFAQRLLSQKARRISPEEADKLLKEGVYVTSSEGRRVGFGKSLKKHIDDHNYQDASERRANLLFAIATVKGTLPVTHNERGFEGRTKWVNRTYSDKIILVVSTPDKKAAAEANIDIDYVFTIRKEDKKTRRKK